MSKKRRMRARVRLDDLTPNDRAEVDKFAQFLRVQASRKAGGDPAVCNMLEAAIYPDGIGRTPADGTPDA